MISDYIVDSLYFGVQVEKKPFVPSRISSERRTQVL